MLFNSLDFALFFPIMFVFYWSPIFRKPVGARNLLIVIGSYIFYGWWDWRFLFLIFASTAVDFIVGLKLMETIVKRKRLVLLLCSIVANLGILGFFKYYNFFSTNFVRAFTFLGYNFNLPQLKIILPVGISFYTFQTLSYSIDVYRKRMEPTKDFITFAAFVSFFPQLVAGPIERATHLLPQFYNEKEFSHKKAVDGMRQILWGFFKKIVIADNCALYVDRVFDNYFQYPASALAVGVVLFAFQIYGDFSGYSDIAIGTARLFGFDLMRNFHFPYFSRDISEFWRRWHISLSSWFRDYLYIPLGGSRGNLLSNTRNIFLVFIVSGFCHGASWKFVIWGGLNALYFLPFFLSGKNRINMDTVAQNRILPSLSEWVKMVMTFCLVCFAWIFFRASSTKDAFRFIERLFSRSLFQFPDDIFGFSIIYLLVGIGVFLIIEWSGRKNEYAIEKMLLNRPIWLRWGLYYLLVGIIVFSFLSMDRETPFIYFDF